MKVKFMGYVRKSGEYQGKKYDNLNCTLLTPVNGSDNLGYTAFTCKVAVKNVGIVFDCEKLSELKDFVGVDGEAEFNQYGNLVHFEPSTCEAF